MKTIESVLISQGDLERIYVGELKLFLWRSLHKEVQVTNPLYPDFEPREVRAGIMRAPDVETKTISGKIYVIAKLGQGTSLFDKPGTFGHKHWTYFEIPEGTEIPPGLIIVKDAYNKKYKATHYSLSPNSTMPKKRFTQLLDQLVRNAVARKGQLNHG